MPQIAPKKAKINQLFAGIITLMIFFIYLAVVWNQQQVNPQRFYILLAIGGLVSYSIFQTLTAKYRNRNLLLKQPFPKNWKAILQQYVTFYNALSPKEQRRFEQNIQIFLSEKEITGIKTKIDDTIRVLVAASAIIPIFGFKEWEYDNLGEVLIYPHSFDTDFRLEGEQRNVLGMVGEGVMKGMMILSKNAVMRGFTDTKDGRNTAIHEFVHLIDAKDGDFDGIPHLLDKQYIVPWLDLMYQEIDKIKSNESSINPYGATNEVEFFATNESSINPYGATKKIFARYSKKLYFIGSTIRIDT